MHGAVHAFAPVLVVEPVGSRIGHPQQLPGPLCARADDFTTSHLVAREATALHPRPVRHVIQIEFLAAQHKSIPGHAEAFHAHRRMLEFGLAGDRVDRRIDQGADACI